MLYITSCYLVRTDGEHTIGRITSKYSDPHTVICANHGSAGNIGQLHLKRLQMQQLKFYYHKLCNVLLEYTADRQETQTYYNKNETNCCA